MNLSKVRQRGVRCIGRRWNSSSTETLRKTGLYDFHLHHGAKVVPFAGYSMPLSYGDVGQLSSHKHVRESAGLFDVGHMVQSIFHGPKAGKLLERLTPSAITSLAPYTSTLSVLLNEQGGIIDDCVITKHSDEKYYVVTNAGRRERDLAWFKSNLISGANVEVLEDWGLVALQGPKAAEVLQSWTDYDLKKLTFGSSGFVKFKGIDQELHVARGGYTGEDGFEISIPPKHTVHFAELLSAHPAVQLTGLAVRDSLRLEAAMCLYGNDLDETIGPVEAGLSWVIGKDRREPGTSAADFIGSESVLKVLKDKPTKRRVGMIVQAGIARGKPTTSIYAPRKGDEPAKEIGVVTSGGPSPTLGKNIAMGYVSTEKNPETGKGYHVKGSPIRVKIRGAMKDAVITEMPFVPSNYYRG
ncbi:glycine cleavage system T protein [Flagelloscypha sp. PMI_526]|nr:glycine cleavage system T protein [Flagelloscypha sp. PMI_526]